MHGGYHIDRLLEAAIKQGARELRLEPGRTPRMYVDGTFKSIGLITLTTNYVDGFASAILSDQAQADLKETGHAITNFEFGSGVRMHVIATRDNGGVRLLIRPFE